MKELIEKWISGRRSYTYGAILYAKFGDDEQMKGLFDKPKTPYSENLLLEKLREMISEAQAVKKSGPAASVYEKMPDSEDPVLKALKDEWMPKFTTMNYKRHELDRWLDEDTAEAQGKRGKLAQEILNLEQGCMVIWAKRDHYVQHGSLPGKSTEMAEPVIDKFMAGKRITTLQTYIRRYRIKLKNNPADAQAAVLLKKYENELNQLQQLHEK